MLRTTASFARRSVPELGGPCHRCRSDADDIFPFTRSTRRPWTMDFKHGGHPLRQSGQPSPLLTVSCERDLATKSSLVTVDLPISSST